MPKQATIDDPIPFKEGPDVFSPKTLIELVRPGTGTANPSGDVGFIPVSQYSLETKKNDKKILIFPIQPNPASAQFASIATGDAFWLDSDTIGHVVVNEENKVQELHAVSIARESTRLVSISSSALIASFPVSDLGNFIYSSQAESLVFSTAAWPDKNIHTIKEQDEAYEKRGHSARVYDQLFVRHWDTWRGPKIQTLFTVSLKKADGKWTLGNDYISPLNNTEHSAPVEPFGGVDHFDISATQIVYTTKDPEVDPASHTRTDIYVVPITGGKVPKRLTSNQQGATSSPVFNKQGTKVAWTEMAEDGYEADRAKIIVYDLEKEVRFTLTPTWDRSAAQLTFSSKGDKIIFTASDHARSKIFSVDVVETPSVTDANVTVSDPVALTSSHSVSNVQPLEDGRILFTRSSFTCPSEVFVLSEGSIEQITRLAEKGLEGKTLAAGEDLWTTGSDNFKVHSWVLKPPGYEKGSGKKWPVVFMVHGGPQGDTADSWSTRWNPNIFVQQGYFLIAPNPTGSTGFGQEFTNRITQNWGSKPFTDLVAVWKAALKAYPEIDADNAVAVGASWGGYAMNWINGHPELGFNFKALVCHDGVFDTRYNGFATEELYFFHHDFNGSPIFGDSQNFDQWNPSRFIDKFSVPQLLIHGSLDYRLPETESLAVFNALQHLKWHQEVLGWIAGHVKAQIE
ncbi:hypothetical protein Clacol_010064 [Clathrus columnatus]|uniref:Dipeptidyl-peptidase V n=1 Tax=Clathrus columnatus TaxID=1419009 RepID=A0AAV5AU04_9AGAM|nr:hypothetical protein Clacol_010064 [Clathrus columnatus]